MKLVDALINVKSARFGPTPSTIVCHYVRITTSGTVSNVCASEIAMSHVRMDTPGVIRLRNASRNASYKIKSGMGRFVCVFLGISWWELFASRHVGIMKCGLMVDANVGQLIIELMAGVNLFNAQAIHSGTQPNTNAFKGVCNHILFGMVKFVSVQRDIQKILGASVLLSVPSVMCLSMVNAC